MLIIIMTINRRYFVKRPTIFVAIFLLAFFPVCAYATPSASSLLAEQKDAVTIKNSIDTKNNKTTFEIEICPSNTCDLFEGESSLDQLANYTYLYSVYIAGFVDFSKPLSNGRHPPMAFISKAIKMGYAKEILDSYSSGLNCQSSADEALCVLKALKKRLSVRHYKANYDEGSRTLTLVKDE